MKALVGSWADRPHRLLAENAALRARVSELVAELHRANEELEILRSAVLRRGMVPSAVGMVDEVVVDDVDLDDVKVEVALTHS